MSNKSSPPPAGGRSVRVADRVGVVAPVTPPRLPPTTSGGADPPPAGEGEVPRNASRFSEARLQAVSSRNMYSEHGFDALIGPEAGQVCQSLMVEWHCRPGSADAHAPEPIMSHSSRAFTGL